MKGTNWRRENKRAKIPRESITSVGLACFCPIYRVRSRASPSAIALTATATAAAAGCPLLPFCPLLAISASSRRRRRPPSFLAPFRPAAKGASRRSLFAYPRLPADRILILLLGLHCRRRRWNWKLELEAIEAVHLGGCSMLHAALAFGGAGAQ
jgi:hypothetical protein